MNRQNTITCVTRLSSVQCVTAYSVRSLIQVVAYSCSATAVWHPLQRQVIN